MSIQFWLFILVLTIVAILIARLVIAIPTRRTVHCAGHRGVGKTTFVTLLLRVGAGKKLPRFKVAPTEDTINYLNNSCQRLNDGLGPHATTDGPIVYTARISPRFSELDIPAARRLLDRLMTGRKHHSLRIEDAIGLLGDPGQPDENRERQATDGASAISGIETLTRRSRLFYVIDATDILEHPARVQHAAEEIREIRMARAFGKNERIEVKVWLVVTKMDALSNDTERDTLISRVASDPGKLDPPFHPGESVEMRKSVERIASLRKDGSVEPHVSFVSALSLALDEFGLDASDPHIRDEHQMRARTRQESEIKELDHLLGLMVADPRSNRRGLRRDLPNIMQVGGEISGIP